MEFDTLIFLEEAYCVTYAALSLSVLGFEFFGFFHSCYVLCSKVCKDAPSKGQEGFIALFGGFFLKN